MSISFIASSSPSSRSSKRRGPSISVPVASLYLLVASTMEMLSRMLLPSSFWIQLNSPAKPWVPV